jgi:mono/diheme cytochrome c family protein
MKPWRFAIVALAAVGCSPALPVPEAADAATARASWPETSLAELQKGRELYVRSCANCHTLKLPDELPPERWRGEVDHMQELGVKLAEGEAELIVRYLETMSRRSDG